MVPGNLQETQALRFQARPTESECAFFHKTSCRFVCTFQCEKCGPFEPVPVPRCLELVTIGMIHLGLSRDNGVCVSLG